MLRNKVPTDTLTTVTANDIACRIVEEHDIKISEAKEFVSTIKKTLCELIEAGHSIQLEKLGYLNHYEKEARIGRNPKTGEEHTISARRVVTFKKTAIDKTTAVKKVILRQYVYIATRHPHSDDMLKTFIDVIREVKEHANTRIELRGLGVFYPSRHSSKVRRNPRTGEKAQCEERIYLQFKLSELLFNKINP
ncbi:HU family DNA-binding protein [Vibrio breoganii]